MVSSNGNSTSSSQNTTTNSNTSQRSSNPISDAWNSPIARALLPDKISLSISSSVTAYFGVSAEMSINFITRGHDASIIPYAIYTLGAQGGLQVSADALFGISIGYYATQDMRNLKPGEAKYGLLGWNIYGSVNAGVGLGGSVTSSVGFSGDPAVSKPTWIDVDVSGGPSISIFGGASGGLSHSFPIIKSQFK